jgi:hypothetical protein
MGAATFGSFAKVRNYLDALGIRFVIHLGRVQSVRSVLEQMGQECLGWWYRSRFDDAFRAVLWNANPAATSPEYLYPRTFKRADFLDISVDFSAADVVNLARFDYQLDHVNGNYSSQVWIGPTFSDLGFQSATITVPSCTVTSTTLVSRASGSFLADRVTPGMVVSGSLVTGIVTVSSITDATHLVLTAPASNGTATLAFSGPHARDWGREATAAVSQGKYGIRSANRKLDYCRATSSAIALVTRTVDLLSSANPVVTFSTDQAPDLERGRVIQFDADVDGLLRCPLQGGGGSWAGKYMWVVEVNQYGAPTNRQDVVAVIAP